MDWEKSPLQSLRNRLSPLPSIKGVKRHAHEAAHSHYPLRVLGHDTEGFDVTLAEEQKALNLDIIGSPGQGKSKLIEMFVRQDLEREQGAFLLDASGSAATMHNLLHWCCATGFEKVIIVDPHEMQWGENGELSELMRVPTIMPKHNMMETIRILFKTLDSADTAIIEQYLPEIFNLLHRTGYTLAEFKYFTNQSFALYRARRNTMLSHLKQLDDTRLLIDELFAKSNHEFHAHFGSTIRRMVPFREPRFNWILGYNKGLDFPKLIKEGWFICANLDPRGVGYLYDTKHQRLLGTLLLNEVFYAVSAMGANNGGNWGGVYNVYVDEVGHYATRALSDFLYFYRKTGLRLTIGHQSSPQIEDKVVTNAIDVGAQVKVAFRLAGADDRHKAAREMYGGSLPDRDVAYNMGSLKKQQASIKIENHEARFFKLKDVPDVRVSPTVFNAYKNKIYSNGMYHSPAEIRKAINARFDAPELTGDESSQSLRPKKTRYPTGDNNKGVAHVAESKPDKTADIRSAETRTIFDDFADSSTLLRDEKGRATRKQVRPKAEGDKSDDI